jgi:hypothetical protein
MQKKQVELDGDMVGDQIIIPTTYLEVSRLAASVG